MTKPAKRKRRRVTGIGPLFAWDLTRLARRGQDARSRTVLALVLLLTLLLFTLYWFPRTDTLDLFFGTQQSMDVRESARFAEQFSLALLIAQMAVMMLLAPAYAAGSIAEEKERRTWPYLLVSDLTNREIVLGKFCGRVVFLLGVMMAGLPVLALTALLGGVDPIFLIFGYLITGSTVVLLTAAGVTAAVYAPTLRGAMFRAYGIAALFCLTGGGINPLFSPLTVLYLLYRSREFPIRFYGLAGTYFFVEILLTILFLAAAITRMRRVERREARRPPRPPPRPVAVAVGTAERRRRSHQPENRRLTARDFIWIDRPRLGNHDPFLWKEKYTQGTARTADDDSIRNLSTVVGVFMAIVMAFIVAVAIPYSFGDSSRGPGTMAAALILTGSACVFAHLLTLAPVACGCIIREKTNRTIESLLMVPEPRERILEAKWLAAFFRGWWWGGPGIGCVVLGLFLSDLSPVAFSTAIFLPAGAALCVSYGLWLSCRCNTITRAVIFYLGLAAVIALLPLAITLGVVGTDRSFAVLVMSLAAITVSIAAWALWKMCRAEFEACGRN